MVLYVKLHQTTSTGAYVVERSEIEFSVRSEVSSDVDDYISLVKNKYLFISMNWGLGFELGVGG